MILQPQVGVGIMFWRDGKVLAGKRKGLHGEGCYGWPGGHLELGESIADCVRREALEETGLEVHGFSVACVYNMVAHDRHYLDIEVSVSSYSGEPVVMEPDRIESWDWYDIDNIPTPMFAACTQAVRAVRIPGASFRIIDSNLQDISYIGEDGYMPSL